MTVDKLAALAGIVLSLIFSYTPGLKTKYDALSADVKRLIMLGMLLVVTAAVFGLGCMGKVDAFPCSSVGVWQALTLFVEAAIANQVTYQLTPKG